MWKPDGLNVSIAEMRAEGPPTRALVVRVVVRSRFETPIYVVRSRVLVNANGFQLANGDFLTLSYAAVKPLVLSPGEENPSGEFRIPLSRESIAWIERHRHGDVELSISAYCTVAAVTADGTLGAPWENIVTEPNGSSPTRFKVPLSQWIQYLASWVYADVELAEIPSELRSGRLAGAWKRWDEAVEDYRRGQWEDSLGACYRAIEDAAWVMTPEGADKADKKALLKLLSPDKKGALYDPVFTAFNELLHTGRHAQASAATRPDRADALFAVSVTHAILVRLG